MCQYINPKPNTVLETEVKQYIGTISTQIQKHYI